MKCILLTPSVTVIRGSDLHMVSITEIKDQIALSREKHQIDKTIITFFINSSPRGCECCNKFRKFYIFDSPIFGLGLRKLDDVSETFWVDTLLS